MLRLKQNKIKLICIIILTILQKNDMAFSPRIIGLIHGIRNISPLIISPIWKNKIINSIHKSIQKHQSFSLCIKLPNYPRYVQRNSTWKILYAHKKNNSKKT